jgi:hypothetical protein
MMEYYSVTKKNEILPFSTTWVKRKITPMILLATQEAAIMWITV